MLTTRTVMASLAAATMLSLLGGCGGDSGSTSEDPSSSAPTSGTPSQPQSPTPSESSEPAKEVSITIEDFTYSDPGPVPPGTEIAVTNEDDATHTVTADGAGDFDVTIAPGAAETFKAPDEPGDYSFICSFHANMSGTLVVG